MWGNVDHTAQAIVDLEHATVAAEDAKASTKYKEQKVEQAVRSLEKALKTPKDTKDEQDLEDILAQLNSAIMQLRRPHNADVADKRRLLEAFQDQIVELLRNAA